MKFWSIFFGCFWVFMAVLAIAGDITPFCAMCACLLAAFYNFEDVLR